MANNWMKGVPAASVSPVIFGFNSEVTMANDEARERAKKAYFKKVGHYTITRSFDAGFDAGYAAAEARIRELEQEVERLKDAIGLRECVHCGVAGFKISPINPAEGYCWNCHFMVKVSSEE